MTATTADRHPPIVLITGATAGIGRATALHLARLGHHVIATGRKVDLLEALRAEATAANLPGRLDTAVLDVTSADSIAAARAEVDRLTGGHGVDVLVNNAGYGLVGPLAEVDDAALRRQFDTNVFGLMGVTRAFVPAMRDRRAGRIVNVSSIGGRVTFPFMGAYHGTKYAVEAFSDALRYELRPLGIDVVVVEPGPIRTNFGDTAMSTIASIPAGSAYGAAIEKAEEIRHKLESRAAPAAAVARVIARAIRRRRPAARYVAPGYARIVFGVAAVLPQRAWDWTMRRMAFLDARTLDAGRKPTGELASPSAN